MGISVVFSSIAGYLLGYEVFSWVELLLLTLGGLLVVAASNAFNQIYEVEQDALMNRTKNRPATTSNPPRVRRRSSTHEKTSYPKR